MNEQELQLLRKLEYIKYITLTTGRIIHSSTAERTHFDNGSGVLTLNTPEGLTLKIKNFRINYKRPDGEGKCSITIDWARDDEGNLGANYAMVPSLPIKEMTNGNKLFVFHSEQFRALPEENRNYYNSEIDNYINSGGFWLHIYSVLIEISQENGHFQSFMSMEYGEQLFTSGSEPTPVYDLDYYPYNIEVFETGTWKYYFNKSVGDALKHQNFENFLKYDSRILKSELTLENRKKILEYLVNEEYWGNADFDGLNEAEFYFSLLESTDESDIIEIYEYFFQNYATFFINSMSKLSSFEDIKLKVIVFLLRCFYKKMSVGYNNIIQNQLENLSEENIIPFIGVKKSFSAGYATLGPNIQVEYTSTGVKIVDLKIYVNIFNDTANSPTSPKDYKLSNGNQLVNNIYSYETMLGGYCCTNNNDAIKVGLMQGRIYPFPAFALFSIDQIFTKEISLLTVMTDFANIAGVFIPFFKVIQGISVFANLTAMGFSLIGNTLDQGLSDIIKGSEEGRKFLIIYNFITTFYSVKGVKGSYSSLGVYMIKDVESLLDAWGVFQGTQFFINLENLNNENPVKKEFNKLKIEMQDFQQIVN